MCTPTQISLSLLAYVLSILNYSYAFIRRLSTHLISLLANRWCLDVPACVLYLPSRAVGCIFGFSFWCKVDIEPLPHRADVSELQDYSHASLGSLPLGLDSTAFGRSPT
ncbi:hypothetical protein F5Y07DRAFT_1900 [Xylaria sp. FL0933]|nr:hypothetical protein F5Y07DRAFT_1900 [Xylaria sp. FL0933]